ncbi:hypothetical protein EC957_010661 [Mortierella hygrophila]|uniref:F-box domain-containing protein n=1 Tax=Mortierella hygrophila TaxID=979708 RepID=A0A9P6K4B2_9FUNG|nr:hypothetical protein EC957_010661 [Mortierella hygrophila]
MDTAVAQVFDIPELANALASHLEKNTLATLVLTCRQFKIIFESWLYRDLTLSSGIVFGGLLLHSTRSVHALSRNIQHIRSLTCGLEEIGYLFNCLLRYQIQIATSTTTDNPFAITSVGSLSSSLPLSRRPRWVPPPDVPPRTCHVIPLAPMQRLVSLKIDVMPSRPNVKIRYRMPTSTDADINVRQICWIIQQSPQLKSLDIARLSVKSHTEMQLLAATVGGLSCLQKIRLSIRTMEEVWQRGFSKMFFTLPRSVMTCKLFGVELSRRMFFRRRGNFYVGSDQEDDAESELDPKDKEWIELARKGYERRNHSELDHEDDQDDIQEVCRRTETLSQLTKFVPWKMNGASSDDILAVFDHCPNIEHLDVPCVSQVGNELESLVRSIKERCPRIRTLSSKRGNDSRHLFCLMETSPHQQLREVKITNWNYTFDNAITRRAFECHSITLRKVDIRYAFGIGSKGILAILELCGSLEVLIKHPGQCESRSVLTLSDAISVPWACKKIRHLEINIGLPEVSQDPYYARSAPVVLSEEERQHFADLERFYRQIGSLVSLEYLDMRAMSVDIEGNPTESTDMNSSKCTFPAMLNLPDCAMGWPGYLNLLAGWVKLKELRGSVQATTDEAKVTVGVQEIEWIAAHWPSLECVAFFTWDGDVKDQRFIRLRDELRPGLSLWQY